MTVRTVCLAMSFALILLGPPPALSASLHSGAETCAAEARALRAQVDRMDHDLQSLETQLYELGNEPSQAARQRELRMQIHRMDHEQELLEDRLRELEKDDPVTAAQRAQPEPAVAAAKAVVASPMAAPMPVVVAPAPAPKAQLGPTLRQAADPAPYEKAAGDRVGMFRYSPYLWVPVGARELAVYNTYDDAYLLDFADDCPGLLTAEHIKVENFSTKVVINRDAVIADGQRCLITGIRELNTRRLPR